MRAENSTGPSRGQTLRATRMGPLPVRMAGMMVGIGSMVGEVVEGTVCENVEEVAKYTESEGAGSAYSMCLGSVAADAARCLLAYSSTRTQNLGHQAVTEVRAEAVGVV